MENKAEPVQLNVEDYLNTRVQDQINWYDRKSGIIKRRYRRMKVLTILFSALVPVCIGFSDNIWDGFKYVASVLGASITIFEGISGMLKDKDTMLSYRNTRETLMREKMLFQTQSGVYDGLDSATALKRFAENCELILGTENMQWVDRFSQEPKDGKIPEEK